MILGIGVDIVEVARIRDAHARFGDRFGLQILNEAELAYCFSHKDPAPFLAVRFAAKEAVSKAFGTGIGAKLGWRDMEVAHSPTGAPHVILHGAAQALWTQRGACALHLSLSHTDNYAVAHAVLEG